MTRTRNSGRCSEFSKIWGNRFAIKCKGLPGGHLRPTKRLKAAPAAARSSSYSGRCCQQTLFHDFGQAAQTRIAVTMQLLGIGEAAFYRFLAPFVDPFAPVRQTPCIDRFLGCLPYMTRQYLGVIGTFCAPLTLLTTGAHTRLGMVMPVTFSSRGAIPQDCSFRATIAVTFLVVDILPFVKIAIAMRRSPITQHACDAPFFEPLANRSRKVTRIESNHVGRKAKTCPLTIQAFEVGLAVVHIARRGIGVGDDGVLAVNGAMVQVKETLRFLVAHHEAALRIGSADFDCFTRWRTVVIVA